MIYNKGILLKIKKNKNNYKNNFQNNINTNNTKK